MEAEALWSEKKAGSEENEASNEKQCKDEQVTEGLDRSIVSTSDDTYCRPSPVPDC